MKRIIDWYLILPEPFRSQAIHNFNLDENNDLTKEAGTLADAITFGFNWDKSKSLDQGTIYWKSLRDQAKSGEFDLQEKIKEESNSDESINNDELESEVKEYFNNLLESKLEPLHKDIKKIKSLMKDILKTFEKIAKSK